MSPSNGRQEIRHIPRSAETFIRGVYLPSVKVERADQRMRICKAQLRSAEANGEYDKLLDLYNALVETRDQIDGLMATLDMTRAVLDDYGSG